MIPTTRFFQGDAAYSNREWTAHNITIISRSIFSCFTWFSSHHRVILKKCIELKWVCLQKHYDRYDYLTEKRSALEVWEDRVNNY